MGRLCSWVREQPATSLSSSERLRSLRLVSSGAWRVKGSFAQASGGAQSESPMNGSPGSAV